MKGLVLMKRYYSCKRNEGEYKQKGCGKVLSGEKGMIEHDWQKEAICQIVIEVGGYVLLHS